MRKALFMCKSVSGRSIHLSRDVWYGKILVAHPEFKAMNDYLEEVKKTMEAPEYVVIGWAGEHLA